MAEKATRKVVKRVKNAILYDDGLIRVSNVRLSYPHLDKPYKKPGDAGVAKYGVVGLMPKKTHKEAKGLIDDAIATLLKDNKIKAVSSDKKFLRDGDESDKDEHAGAWTISAREERRPTLRQTLDDGTLEAVEQEDAKETFYGGCWGSILIRPWFQNNDWGKRANAGLTAVTKKADDESFGEGRISDEEAEEAFDDDDELEMPRRGSANKSKSRYEEDDEEETPRRRSKPKPAADDDDPDDL